MKSALVLDLLILNLTASHGLTALHQAGQQPLPGMKATTILGQNTLAIAATEAQYAEMSAQDVAAQLGYGLKHATAGQAERH